MVAFDPFEMIDKLRHADIDPLVETLRRIHREGRPNISSLDQLLQMKPGPESSDPQENQASTGPSIPDDGRYEELRRHCVPYAERLREQSILTDKLLKGFVADAGAETPAVLQQEIRIQAFAGTQSGGRFIIVNSLGKPTDVRFRQCRIHGLPPERESRVRIRFLPESPHLEPGEERPIQVTVDLESHDTLPDKVEASIDIYGGDLLLLKLWIPIEIRRPVQPQWITTT
jgi:hypothetical protein